MRPRGSRWRFRWVLIEASDQDSPYLGPVNDFDQRRGLAEDRSLIPGKHPDVPG